jgi:hypothetical protein
MNEKRPFQFSIKALLGITVLAAVVAWFAALKEPVSVIAVTAYLAIGLHTAQQGFQLNAGRFQYRFSRAVGSALPGGK